MGSGRRRRALAKKFRETTGQAPTAVAVRAMKHNGGDVYDAIDTIENRYRPQYINEQPIEAARRLYANGQYDEIAKVMPGAFKGEDAAASEDTVDV